MVFGVFGDARQTYPLTFIQNAKNFHGINCKNSVATGDPSMVGLSQQQTPSGGSRGSVSYFRCNLYTSYSICGHHASPPDPNASLSAPTPGGTSPAPVATAVASAPPSKLGASSAATARASTTVSTTASLDLPTPQAETPLVLATRVEHLPERPSAASLPSPVYCELEGSVSAPSAPLCGTVWATRRPPWAIPGARSMLRPAPPVTELLAHSPGALWCPGCPPVPVPTATIAVEASAALSARVSSPLAPSVPPTDRL